MSPLSKGTPDGSSRARSRPPIHIAAPKRSAYRAYYSLLARAGCVAWLLLAVTASQAQSEDPSDAVASLTSNAFSPVPSLTAAIPATCIGACNGPFDLGTVSSTTPQSIGLAYPPCQVGQAISTPTPPKDIWFRLVPAYSDAAYRFILYGAGTPAMAKGGMAVYEAASAAGPFRLLDCAITGGVTLTMPAVEATGITAGYNLYIRVWDRTPANTKFNIAVMGHRASLLTGTADRGADETPCAARTVTPVGTFSPSGAIINYTFACDEGGFLHTTPEKAGGDLWVKLVIPPTGNVRLKPSVGTSTANKIGAGTGLESDNIGLSAYLASDCSNYATFKEVGSIASLLLPTTAAIGMLDIKCLPPGETLYVRFYTLQQAAIGSKQKRFGQFRFEWMTQSAVGTPPINCDPCSAGSAPVGNNAWGTPCAAGVTGSTYMSCNTPGVPAPVCGGFSAATGSVWYKFIAPLTGLVVIDAGPGAAPATQPAIGLYTTNAVAGDPADGCRLRMNLMDCDDRQGPGQNARIIRGGLIPGQIYYVRVWSKNGGAEGNFSLCITSPPPPAGSCWHMINLYAKNSIGTLAMQVTIAPDPLVTYTTSGGDPSEAFLVPVPIGATANFRMLPSGGGIGTSGYIFWGVWQANSADTLWYSDGGYAIAGPSGGVNDSYTLTNACSPRPRPTTDCFGMRTVCLDGAGATHQVAGQMDNRSWPRRNYSSANVDYQGYAFRPHIGDRYDLAGTNLGCLDGENNGIQWMVFQPEQNGTVAFLLEGFRVSPAPTVQADLDFAVWDLGLLEFQGTVPESVNGYDVCPPKTAPIRCSSGRNQASTGLAAGMTGTMEGHGGFGWLKPLEVQSGHGYLIAMVPQEVGRINYSLNWTLFKDALGASAPGIITCEPLLLPVELLFLAAQQKENEVDLTWATASEKNSSEFIVERSTNAFDFTPIGKVAASGDSQYRIDYTFTDPSPMGGLNYYRLTLVDRDGSSEASNVVAVMFTGDGSRVLVWPNPARDRLNVSADLRGQSIVQVKVVDALGRLVQRSEVPVSDGQERLEVDTQGLSSGSYMVHISTSSGMPIGTAHFVKE